MTTNEFVDQLSNAYSKHLGNRAGELLFIKDQRDLEVYINADISLIDWSGKMYLKVVSISNRHPNKNEVKGVIDFADNGIINPDERKLIHEYSNTPVSKRGFFKGFVHVPLNK